MFHDQICIQKMIHPLIRLLKRIYFGSKIFIPRWPLLNKFWTQGSCLCRMFHWGPRKPLLMEEQCHCDRRWTNHHECDHGTGPSLSTGICSWSSHTLFSILTDSFSKDDVQEYEPFLLHIFQKYNLETMEAKEPFCSLRVSCSVSHFSCSAGSLKSRKRKKFPPWQKFVFSEMSLSPGCMMVV